MNYYIIERDHKLVLLKVPDSLNDTFLQENTDKIIVQAKSIADALDLFSKQEEYQPELLETQPVRFRWEE
jgi:hypothetical protein